MTIRHDARSGDSSRRSLTSRAAIAGAIWCCAFAAVAAPDVAAPQRQHSERAAPTGKRDVRTPAPPRRPAPPVVIEPQPAPPPELPPLDVSTPPPSLPKAPRERMKLCAAQWLKLRQDRQTGGTSWREFATECLAR